jgi:hypothetical protein
MLQMALEFEHPNSGRWDVLQSEEIQNREEIEAVWTYIAGSMNSRIYFKRDYETDFSTLFVEVDAMDYEMYLYSFRTEEPNKIEIPLRVMYYDNEWTPIEALSSYFSVVVTYEGESSCAEASIYKKEQVPSKYILSFTGDEDIAATEVMETAE